MPKTFTAEQIYEWLTSQRFANWYMEGDFAAHITGDEPTVTKATVLAQIDAQCK